MEKTMLITVKQSEAILERAKLFQKTHLTLEELESKAVQHSIDPKFLKMALDEAFAPNPLVVILQASVRNIKYFVSNRVDEIEYACLRHGHWLILNSIPWILALICDSVSVSELQGLSGLLVGGLLSIFSVTFSVGLTFTKEDNKSQYRAYHLFS